MGALSVRGIDEELAKRIKQQAAEERKSINQYVLDLLKRESSLAPSPKFTAVHHDLDHLFGAWKAEDAEAIDAAISEGRKIDPELWK